MTTQQKQQQSIFPDYPREQPAIDKNGNFNALWELGLSALFQALQTNFKDEGIRIPLLSAVNMATIQALYMNYIGGTYNALTLALPDISGQTVFDTDNYITNQFVIAKDTIPPQNVLFAEWVPLAVMLTGTVNPSGVTAGIISWLYYDTAGKVLYICTATGSATTATWQAV